MVCPRVVVQANPWEFRHFSFQEDSFSTLGPKFSVKFPSLLGAFLEKFFKMADKNPFPGGAVGGQIPFPGGAV